MQIPGWKWFPLLKRFPPTEPREARRGASSLRPEGAQKFLSANFFE